MTEYWLQKKILGGWSQVTWYSDLEQAIKNYLQCVGNGSSGYSWRLVEISILSQSLNDAVEIKTPEVDVRIKERDWTMKASHSPASPKSTGWGGTLSGWSNSTENDPGAVAPALVDAEHGLSGSVWLVHHGQKAKVRVKATEAQRYLDEGYERGGPRTQFREE